MWELIVGLSGLKPCTLLEDGRLFYEKVLGQGVLPVGQGGVFLQGLGRKGWQLFQVTPYHLIAERESQETSHHLLGK